VLTQRASRVRDWALFALAAIAPAIGVGALAWSALGDAEAAARRETSVALEAAATQSRLAIDQALSRAADRLRARRFEGNAAQIGAHLDALRPPFAESVVLGADRRVLWPAPPRGADAAPAPPRCKTLAARFAEPSLHGAARTALRREFLGACAEAESETGRFLWPVIALDGLEASDGPRLYDWLQGHVARMRPAEREAPGLDFEAARALSAPLRQKIMALLVHQDSPRAALLDELGRSAVANALAGEPDASGLLRWRAGGTLGVLRVLRDHRLAGFVVYRASLEAALDALPLASGQRAFVTSGAPSKAEPGLVAHAELAPALAIEVVPADAGVVARHAARSRELLAAVALGAIGLAFAFAALLFARMRAAKRSSELRTDFVSAVSHELRTPIASVRMLAELLEDDRVEPAERGEVYEAIARESRRLGETVNRLLGFSRMSAGRLVLERAPTSVARAVGESIDTFEERHPDAPRVERDLSPELVADVDAGQVRLAVDNLLENALKYAPGGAPYRVSVAANGRDVSISVGDRGPGIARRDQARIFKPFERLDDRLSRETEGSGIGLALVEQVARAHGGWVTVDSEPGHGATFTLKLPVSS
jgi:signal transduction histidine kinase